MSENQTRSGETSEAPLDWAALLGRWMEFARAAVVLPDDGEGRRWRASISPIITLQAVSLALGELKLLPPDERPVAIDRAGLLIEHESSTLGRVWDGAPPREIERLLDDAAASLKAAQSGENNIGD